jgi:tight adherence protein B
MNFAGLAPGVTVAVAACALAVLIGFFAVLAPGPTTLPLARRRPAIIGGPSRLTRSATMATDVIDRVIRRRADVEVHTAVLERAGVKMRLQDLVLLVIAGALVAGAAGFVLSGPLLGILLAIAVPVVARVALNVMAGRRRSAFADQLDDSLQLLASSLRAGHSLLQAIASVAREAEEPTKDEFARILNESRVGRELRVALDETAVRMASDDFVWVTQAIAINREVGGNLAEVLDGVGHTIRERNQIRGQVKALSAEGKLSAYVLMALPIGVVVFLAAANPDYIGKLVQNLAGYVMIGVCVLLMVVGALWLRKVVSFKF